MPIIVLAAYHNKPETAWLHLGELNCLHCYHYQMLLLWRNNWIHCGQTNQ